ncbi:MAG: acyl-CoA synthetase [Myxococcota bacterium]
MRDYEPQARTALHSDSQLSSRRHAACGTTCNEAAYMSAPGMETAAPADPGASLRELLAEKDLPTSTYALFERSAQRFEQKTALTFLPMNGESSSATRYSYRELLHQITRTANAFTALGVRPSDAVSLLLPNLPQTHFCIWGAEAVARVNPLNPMLDAEHLAAVMNEAGSRILVTAVPEAGQGLWEKVQQVIADVPGLATVLLVDGGDAGKDCGGAGDDCFARFGLDSQCTFMSFDSFIAQQDGNTLAVRPEYDPQQIASLFHTGGTTGTPKLAPHSHANEVVMAWQLAQSTNLDASAVALCGLPLFHVNAVFVTGLAPWLVGGEVILASPQGYRNPKVMDRFWSLVERYRVSYFSAVPTILSDLLKRDSGDLDLSSLDFCACGAAPLAMELLKQFEERTGLRVLEGYGQTEGTCASTSNPRDGERRLGSVGRALPCMELRTVELDDLGEFTRDCGPDEIGNILIKGPNVFSGYTREAHNRGLWFEGGWFKTGDLGRLDSEGYLWLTGRSKDLIIRGGHNIDPQSIEEVLYRHPAVLQAAAVGRPDKRVGEVPVAYLQLAYDVAEEEIIAFARNEISERAAVPKAVYLVDALPITAVGKIYKPALRNDCVKRVVEAELRAVDGLQGQTFRVDVADCKRNGQIVTLTLPDSEPLREAVRAELDCYAFAYELLG